MKKILTAVVAAAALGGCFGGGSTSGTPHAGTVALAASNTQPAAEGTVKFAEGKNGNTELDLKVKHLASPERLTPTANTYVVWTQRDPGTPPQNMGALQVNKNLDGSLTTVTPLKRFDVFVTAEPTAVSETPTGKKQLWTTVPK